MNIKGGNIDLKLLNIRSVASEEKEQYNNQITKWAYETWGDFNEETKKKIYPEEWKLQPAELMSEEKPSTTFPITLIAIDCSNANELVGVIKVSKIDNNNMQKDDDDNGEDIFPKGTCYEIDQLHIPNSHIDTGVGVAIIKDILSILKNIDSDAVINEYTHLANPDAQRICEYIRNYKPCYPRKICGYEASVYSEDVSSILKKIHNPSHIDSLSVTQPYQELVKK